MQEATPAVQGAVQGVVCCVVCVCKMVPNIIHAGSRDLISSVCFIFCAQVSAVQAALAKHKQHPPTFCRNMCL